MRYRLVFLPLVISLLLTQTLTADFAGPSPARNALSPDGQLLVRITTPKRDKDSKDLPKHEVSYYEFDAIKDVYTRSAHFPLTGYLGEMLYVSNAGDLIMISLGEKEAVRLYSKEGQLRTELLHSLNSSPKGP
jgi:hypothetical protein